MIFMEPFWILVDVISGEAKKEDQKRGDPRYVKCLHCGALVVKSEVKGRGGCYVCGWVPGAETVRKDERVLRVKCPQCGGLVLKSELIKRGCYLCGWK